MWSKWNREKEKERRREREKPFIEAPIRAREKKSPNRENLSASVSVAGTIATTCTRLGLSRANTSTSSAQMIDMLVTIFMLFALAAKTTTEHMYTK